MPVFNILLAHDIPHYGTTSVEAATWQEAVRSLVCDDWWDICVDMDDIGFDARVVHVETEEGDIVAEGLHYDRDQLSVAGVQQRLREIQIAPDQDAALALFIDELRTMSQDPVFKKPVFNKESN